MTDVRKRVRLHPLSLLLQVQGDVRCLPLRQLSVVEHRRLGVDARHDFLDGLVEAGGVLLLLELQRLQRGAHRPLHLPREQALAPLPPTCGTWRLLCRFGREAEPKWGLRHLPPGFCQFLLLLGGVLLHRLDLTFDSLQLPLQLGYHLILAGVTTAQPWKFVLSSTWRLMFLVTWLAQKKPKAEVDFTRLPAVHEQGNFVSIAKHSEPINLLSIHPGSKARVVHQPVTETFFTSSAACRLVCTCICFAAALYAKVARTYPRSYCILVIRVCLHVELLPTKSDVRANCTPDLKLCFVFKYLATH
mmetsp:Transcript_9175/g.18974  ORF Transcript_9175/g.18974 Transcript_9175/m.18974 type:complete len:303 (-) Transcript_9175:156-1064(-)